MSASATWPLRAEPRLGSSVLVCEPRNAVEAEGQRLNQGGGSFVYLDASRAGDIRDR